MLAITPKKRLVGPHPFQPHVCSPPQKKHGSRLNIEINMCTHLFPTKNTSSNTFTQAKQFQTTCLWLLKSLKENVGGS